MLQSQVLYEELLDTMQKVVVRSRQLNHDARVDFLKESQRIINREISDIETDLDSSSLF